MRRVNNREVKSLNCDGQKSKVKSLAEGLWVGTNGCFFFFLCVCVCESRVRVEKKN